jgi:hypothetical protein
MKLNLYGEFEQNGERVLLLSNDVIGNEKTDKKITLSFDLSEVEETSISFKTNKGKFSLVAIKEK